MIIILKSLNNYYTKIKSHWSMSNKVYNLSKLKSKKFQN